MKPVAWVRWAGLALCTAAAARAFAVRFPHPLGPDAGAYLMSALAVGEGAVPLIDFPTIYPPGGFYLLAGYHALHGGGWSGLWLQVVLHQLLIAGLLGAALVRWRLSSPLLAGALAAFYLAMAPLYQGLYPVLEPLSALWGWLGVLIAVHLAAPGADPALPSPRRCLALALAAGLAVGVAVMVKQVGGIFVLLGAGLAATLPAARRRGAVLAIGVAAASPWLLFFALHPEAFDPWLRDNIGGLLGYAGAAPAQQPIPLGDRLLLLWKHRWIVVPLVAGGLLAAWRWRSAARSRRHLTVLMACASGGLSLLPSLARPYEHYYLFPLPFAILAFAYLLAELGRGAARWPAAATLLVTIASLPAREALTAWEPEIFHWERDVAAWIDEHRDGADRALIGPDVSQLYYLASVEAPTLFYWFYPGPKELAATAEQRLPIFLVNRGKPAFTDFRAAVADLGYRPVAGEPRLLVELWLPAETGPGRGSQDK